MKDVTIPGSKFILSLDDEESQWWLRLRINNAIEEQVQLTHLESKTLKTNITDLLNSAHVMLNELQISMLHKEIWEFIQQKLEEERNKGKRNFGVIHDDRVEDMIPRLNKLEDSIKLLERRISEKERLLN